MKMKKIMSAIVAGAMAVSTMASMSIMGASAESSSKSLWTGTQEFTSGWSGNVTIGASNLQYWSDASVTVDFTCTDGTDYSQLQLKYADAGYSWHDLSEVVTVTGETSYTFDLSASDLETVTAGTQFIVGGCNVTVTKVTITGDYNAPTFDAWTDNGDGTYSYVNSAQGSQSELVGDASVLYIDLSKYTTADYADIQSITVDMETTGYANGCIGLNDAAGDWKSANHSGSSVTLNVDGVEDGQQLQVQLWWMNAGSKATVKNVTIEAKEPDGIVANRLYCQKTDVENGVYSERFVMMISEEDAANYSKVKFAINNGSKTANVYTTKYYTSISAAGATIVPGDGYVFVAYALKNIPEDVTLTADVSFE